MPSALASLAQATMCITGRDLPTPLNLFVAGGAAAAGAGFTLFLANQGVSQSAPLSITGAGVTDGAVPGASSLNLFFSRDTAAALPLSLRAQGDPAASGVGFVTAGAVPAAGGLNLAVPEAVGGAEGACRFFTFGF